MINLKKGFIQQNFIKKTSGGFTLIELLVVVAIIGILASVVLGSLNTAKAKGINAAIKGTLGGARTQAQLYFDENKTYTGVCGNGINAIGPIVLSGAQKLGLEATVEGNGRGFSYNASGLPTALGDALCYESDTQWVAIISLKAPSALSSSGWCVDYTGKGKEIITLSPIALSCP